jgi:protocatechuate 3,4-dioxygenase beta subunit
LDQVIGNATVKAERITWNAWELPPANTEVWTTKADANGAFTFDALPPGGYSITATTGMLGGAHDFRVMENGQIRGPRNVKMYPTLSSYGLLLDSAGAPVPGAAIYPISHEMFARQEFDHVTVCGIRAQTDAQGRFMFAGIIPGSWKLYVVAPGHKPFYTDYVPCYGLRTTVVIEEPGTIRGRITNAAGNGAPGLKGTIRAGRSLPTYDDYQPRYRVENAFVSDAEGRFELPEVAPGVYTFDLDDPALVLKDPEQKIEVASARTREVELRVISGGTIYGHVLNAKTSEGIPNVTLSAYSRSAGGSVEKRCITGETGDYIFTGLPEGSFEIYARTDDSFLDSSRELPPVQVKLGETIENKDILLNPAFMLSGRVVDSLDNPVAAQVNASGDNVYKSTVAKADGTFALPLPDKARVSIWAWSDRARSEKVQIVPSESADEPVVLKLSIAAGGSIEGCVQDMQGKPVYNARVNAFSVSGDLANPRSDGGNALTNATGQFRIFGLTPGRYTIEASTQIGKEIGGVVADVVQDTPTRNVLIQDKPEGTLTIKGSISYPGGLPCPVAALGLDNQQLIASGPMGGFEFTQLGEGSYTIYALSPGYSPVVLSGVAAGSRDVRIVLQNFAILTGNVVDKTTGKPVPRFSVRYVMQSYPPFDTAGVEGGEDSFANSDGSFRIEKAPVAPLNVEIKAEGYALWSTAIPDPIPGQENVVNAELSAAATITGVIVDTAGNPIASAEVIGSRVNVRSDDKGHFELPGLPLGQESQIVVIHSSYAQAVVNVVADSSESLEIVLAKGGSVRIKATDAGRPVLMFSAMVSAQGDASTPRPARRMATNVGEVLIERFTPGEADVTVYLPTQDQTMEEFGKAVVTVIDGQESAVEVTNTP